MEYREPVRGLRIYVPTSLSIGHGQDDVRGGLATIERIMLKECENEYNTVFCTVKEVRGKSYNWRYLLSNQDKWAIKYDKQIARNDPDYYDYGSY
ncbi:hypothetical protein [Brevibacillus brevis]|uniref:hypothetical protein n=1 Tax=Brevibacillus brevis TaxID=1393 RepID=UPI000ADD159B|nr:hypothetical protein [Brevibacillus brevis]